MLKLAIAAFTIVIGVGLAPQEAEAKRLGGGKSFGMQRQASPAPAAPAAAPAQAAKPATPAPAMKTFAGGIVPAAVTWPLKKRPKALAASMTAR